MGLKPTTLKQALKQHYIIRERKTRTNGKIYPTGVLVFPKILIGQKIKLTIVKERK